VCRSYLKKRTGSRSRVARRGEATRPRTRGAWFVCSRASASRSPCSANEAPAPLSASVGRAGRSVRADPAKRHHGSAEEPRAGYRARAVHSRRGRRQASRGRRPTYPVRGRREDRSRRSHPDLGVASPAAHRSHLQTDAGDHGARHRRRATDSAATRSGRRRSWPLRFAYPRARASISALDLAGQSRRGRSRSGYGKTWRW
jgi:hypothetical protein